MKRLNRNGFTLVELLAVIVILAIVVGITLVTVLPTLQKSRQQAFELTANTAADFLEKQYQSELIGELNVGSLSVTVPKGTPTTMTADDFRKAGLKPENYVLTSSTWYINTTTGRACVSLTAATKTNSGDSAGEYHDVSPDVASSTGCTGGTTPSSSSSAE